jgi:hypothetical protein
MILIAGDSWGCGCWTEEQTLYHRGIEQLLHNDGHRVINLSQGGSDLDEICQRLSDFLTLLKESTPLWFTESVTKIFVLQTEWHRQIFKEEDKPELHQYNNKGDDQKIIASFYGTLSFLATKYNVDIQVIGGCSDTIWLDNFEQFYPGVNISCQSFTNLVINDNHRINDPIHCVRFPKQLLNAPYTIELAEQGQTREKIWQDNPQWFFPDGCHPNHLAHEKLYSHLKKENVI